MTQFQTKILKCKECGNEFPFTVGEQEYFERKGLMNQPKRCKECRGKRHHSQRPEGRARDTRGGRHVTTVRCSQCGAEAQVPFKPSQGRPVYCRDCFAIRRGQR